VRDQRGQGPFFLFVIVLLVMGAESLDAWACRLLEPPAGRSDILWVHLEGFCLSKDQQAWAVNGADIIEALKNGQDIDLQGVLVVGDVMLDQLPLQAAAEIPNLPATILAQLQQRGLDSVRVVSDAVTIRDSQFEKILATNLSQGALVMLGAVDVSGTTFLQSVDFSKTIFANTFVFDRCCLLRYSSRAWRNFWKSIFRRMPIFHRRNLLVGRVFLGRYFMGQ